MALVDATRKDIKERKKHHWKLEERGPLPYNERKFSSSKLWKVEKICPMNWVTQVRRFPGKVLKAPPGFFFLLKWKCKKKKMQSRKDC